MSLSQSDHIRKAVAVYEARPFATKIADSDSRPPRRRHRRDVRDCATRLHHRGTLRSQSPFVTCFKPISR